MANRSIVFVGIAPHPPIMVPEVGGEATREVRGSIEAMRELTLRIVSSGAETVVIVSPHAPLESHAFVAYEDPILQGSFAYFRAPHVEIVAPLDDELLSMISATATEDNYNLLKISGLAMDHGTTVPLYFLQRNGWRGRVVALGYSFLSHEDHVRFGSSIKRAADECGRKIAIIASGDLSHRLKPDAPAGYHPEAHLFDEEIVNSIRTSDLNRITGMDDNLRKLAGECGYRSILVAMGVAVSLGFDCEVLHYEAPFGVGYLVAQIARVAESTREG